MPSMLGSWDVTAAVRGFGAKLTGVIKIARGTKRDVSGRGRKKGLAVSLAGQKEADSSLPVWARVEGERAAG